MYGKEYVVFYIHLLLLHAHAVHKEYHIYTKPVFL